MKKDPVILGIDPGIGTTGLGAIRAKKARPEYIAEFGIITKREKKLTKTVDAIKRVREISRLLDQVIEAVEPSLISMETFVFFSPERGGMGGSSATTTGRILGMIHEKAGHRGIPVVELTTQRIKALVVGHAGGKRNPVNKDVVKRHVQMILGITPRSGHTSDALAAALAGQAYLRRGEGCVHEQ